MRWTEPTAFMEGMRKSLKCYSYVMRKVVSQHLNKQKLLQVDITKDIVN